MITKNMILDVNYRHMPRSAARRWFINYRYRYGTLEKDAISQV